MAARILLFALDALRARYGHLVAPGADPRHDTAPFRAFRSALLDALAPVATGGAELTMWWEGGFDGYALAVAIDPDGAVQTAAASASRACPVDAERVGSPRRDRLPMARIDSPTWEVLREASGASIEAPFGSATGHFGAPGMRRVP